MDRKQSTLCKIHTLRAVQIASCIVCKSASPVCETKGCIKHHMESEKMHVSYTIKDVQKIAEDYVSANDQKRNIVIKLVNDYFKALKGQIQNIFHEVSHNLEGLRQFENKQGKLYIKRFQNFLMDKQQIKLAQMLVVKRYSELTCSDIARVIPKMQKCTSFQEKQFNHLKDYVFSQKQKIPRIINNIILNLPYFRDNNSIVAIQKFTQIGDDMLNNVNAKLQALSYRPKKLRIKYSEDEVFQLIQRVFKFNVNNIQQRRMLSIIKQKFIKHLESNPHLKEVEQFQIYTTWNISEEPFQVQFMDAVLALPFLNSLTIYTGYKVTSTEFIEEMVENKNVQLKIYKKNWHF